MCVLFNFQFYTISRIFAFRERALDTYSLNVHVALEGHSEAWLDRWILKFARARE